MAVQISLTYNSREDRLHVTTVTAASRAHWWMTRRLAVQLFEAWLGKLDEVAPPSAGLSWMPQAGERKLHEEHALSLEFDAVRHASTPAVPTDQDRLVASVQLNVSPMATRLILEGAGRKASLALTRKESHALLEAMGMQIRKARWDQGMTLPDWIGRSRPGPPEGG